MTSLNDIIYRCIYLFLSFSFTIKYKFHSVVYVNRDDGKPKDTNRTYSLVQRQWLHYIGSRRWNGPQLFDLKKSVGFDPGRTIHF